MRKPNSETFEWVLKDAGILAQETLFIEDSIPHIESANKVGIQTQLWSSNEPFKGFFLDKAL
jgi:putative hydrolase of the HAD superfamily